MHAWFEAQVSAANDTSGRADAFSSLVYACVKMRRLEDAFRARERMEQQRLPVSSRVLASLLKGCGRAREVRRGEALFDSLPPHAADTVVYNAMINMYAHQRLRPLTLSAAQVADSWSIFSQMVERGVMPDEVTYNSLISICGRSRSADVKRAEMVMAEMDAVGIAPTKVTAAALMQVYGRAEVIARGRARLTELIQRGVEPEPTAWRPLLHQVAMRGHLQATEEIIAEVWERTGKDVFDANPYKPCHVNNYRILALGAAEGFEAALAAAHAARAANKADPLTYSFLVETALGEVTSVRKRLPTSVEANERANAVWELMRADGVRPSIALCHRMFGVWAQSGQLERAEAAFEEMRAASLLLLRSSSALADLWERAAKLGGDLSEVERQLEATPLLSLGHNFFSYVKIVESCVEAGAPIDKIAHFLWAALDEVKERGVPLPWRVSEQLIKCLIGDGKSASARQPTETTLPDPARLDLARQLQLKLAEADGRPPPVGSLALVAQLIRVGQVEHAASALVTAGDLSPNSPHASGALSSSSFWPYKMMRHKYSQLRILAKSMADGQEKARVEALLDQVAAIYDTEGAGAAAPADVTMVVGGEIEAVKVEAVSVITSAEDVRDASLMGSPSGTASRPEMAAHDISEIAALHPSMAHGAVVAKASQSGTRTEEFMGTQSPPVVDNDPGAVSFEVTGEAVTKPYQATGEALRIAREEALQTNAGVVTCAVGEEATLAERKADAFSHATLLEQLKEAEASQDFERCADLEMEISRMRRRSVPRGDHAAESAGADWCETDGWSQTSDLPATGPTSHAPESSEPSSVGEIVIPGAESAGQREELRRELMNALRDEDFEKAAALEAQIGAMHP